MQNSKETKGFVGAMSRACDGWCGERKQKDGRSGETVVVPMMSLSETVKIQNKLQTKRQKIIKATKKRKTKARKKRDLKEVQKIRKTSEKARSKTVDRIREQEQKADSRVQKRLALRKKAKQTGALKKCVAFAKLSDASRDHIVDAMMYENIAHGAVLFMQGDPADSLYLLMSGSCTVLVNMKEVGSLKMLDVFGESALFAKGDEQDPSRFRNATVIALNELEILVLKKRELSKLLGSGDLDETTIAALAHVAQERKTANLGLNLSFLPTLNVEVVNVSSYSPLQVKCQNTKAALRKVLSKKKLYAFMKRADKKQSGWLRRKHVEKLIGGIRVKLMEVVEFDDDVWRSMKSSSSLKKQKNFPKEIEHEAFEEWIFGEKDAAKNNQQNMEEQVESLFH